MPTCANTFKCDDQPLVYKETAGKTVDCLSLGTSNEDWSFQEKVGYALLSLIEE